MTGGAPFWLGLLGGVFVVAVVVAVVWIARRRSHDVELDEEPWNHR